MSQNIDRISIQVGLSGYSFKIQTADEIKTSPWMSAERIFSTPEFLNRYDEVGISVFTPKFTLVPEQFNDHSDMVGMLAPVADVDGNDEVMTVSDRILVMYEGEIVGELDPKKTTVAELGLYMSGAKRSGKGEQA